MLQHGCLVAEALELFKLFLKKAFEIPGDDFFLPFYKGFCSPHSGSLHEFIWYSIYDLKFGKMGMDLSVEPETVYLQ